MHTVRRSKGKIKAPVQHFLGKECYLLVVLYWKYQQNDLYRVSTFLVLEQ